VQRRRRGRPAGHPPRPDHRRHALLQRPTEGAQPASDAALKAASDNEKAPACRGFFTFRAGLRPGEGLGDLLTRGAEALLARLVTVGQALGADHFDIADAEEAEDQLQVVLVGGAAGLAGMDAAGAGNDDHLLAAGQAFRPSV
jgi:hypothetical protein